MAASSSSSASGASSAATMLVTGATGYIASWIVRDLLAAGHRVRGTVRDPAKAAHLRAFPGAEERLKLEAADLLASDAFAGLADGVDVIFHTASPFHLKAREMREMVEPAVNGTLAALREASRAGVRRVVLTSSTGAVIIGSKPRAKDCWDDSDWSNEEWMREHNDCYHMSKTLAERAAWEFMDREKPAFELVVMNPTLVTGPMLQPSLNTSCEILRDIAVGTRPSVSNEVMGYVDVRDVSFAHIQAAFAPSADVSGRRFLLIRGAIPWTEAADIVRAALPESLRGRVTSTVVDKGPQNNLPYNTTPAETVLGVKFMSIEDTISDTVRALLKDGFIPTDA